MTDDVVANITFEEAARGCEFVTTMSQKCVCIKCDGTKSEWGYQGAVCRYCEGTGILPRLVLLRHRKFT